MNNILILVNDDKYRVGLSEFLAKHFEGSKVVPLQTVDQFMGEKLSDFTVAIVGSQLAEGPWLKILPILKKVKNIILLGVPGGPDTTPDLARKYGARFYFPLPMNSGELIKALQIIMSEKEYQSEQRNTLPGSFHTEMEALYQGLTDMNYYEFLMLPRTALAPAIKEKYIELVRKYHPDKFRNTSEELKRMAYEITKRANEAYSVLTHPNRKNIYDKSLAESNNNRRYDFHIKVNYEQNAEDTIMNKNARRFVILARQAMAEKQYRQALTQLKLAKSMEKDNEYLNSLITEAEEKIKQVSDK